jgi:hypothetical protein
VVIVNELVVAVVFVEVLDVMVSVLCVAVDDEELV